MQIGKKIRIAGSKTDLKFGQKAPKTSTLRAMLILNSKAALATKKPQTWCCCYKVGPQNQLEVGRNNSIYRGEKKNTSETHLFKAIFRGPITPSILSGGMHFCKKTHPVSLPSHLGVAQPIQKGNQRSIASSWEFNHLTICRFQDALR